MRVHRKRRSIVGPILTVVIVAIFIIGIFGYILDRKARTSPEYTAQRVSYLLRNGDDYVFIYVDSTKNSVKIINLKNKRYLYDPETKLMLNGENLEKDLRFFKDVFGVESTYSYYINLDGGNILKFSKTLLGKNYDDLTELVNALRMRRKSIIDSIRVDSMAKNFRLFSNLTGPALLKLLDSMSDYVVSAISEVETLTKYPVKIIVGKEKEKEFSRLYITKEGKDKIKKFLGVVGSD